MTFTTLSYLLFLPLTCGLYWMLGRRAQNLLLVAASFVFYAWWDWRFCSLLLFSAAVDFWVGLGLDRARLVFRRRALLAVSLVANLGLLGFFKYYNFFAENLQLLGERVGWRMDALTLHVVLPVGISFYTFQTLSYTIDIFRGKIGATRHFWDYLAYVSFFPQLVAGPIERAPRLLPQFERCRRFDERLASDGASQILWGFCKKLVIADRLAELCDQVYASLDTSSGPTIAFATGIFALQIYCDFSAYSDIAIGTGRLFGFDLMRNFAYPYFSRSLAEFWRRWHISLSTWFRDYVYVPLGGRGRTRAGWLRNILLTFVISGFWHGASWNFVIWGGIMGLGLWPMVLRGEARRRTPADVPGGPGRLPTWPDLGRMLGVFVFTCCGWIFFRAPTLDAALAIWHKLVSEALSGPAWAELSLVLGKKEGYAALGAAVFIVVVEWLQRRRQHALQLPNFSRPWRWLVLTAVVWLTLFAGPKGDSRFIYFQF